MEMFPKPISWLGMENYTKYNKSTHSPIKRNVLQPKINKLDAKNVFPNINHTQPPKGLKSAVVVPDDLDLQLVRARNQTRLPCEFGANPFRSSTDISYTNKKTQTDGAKNRTFRRPGLVASYLPGNG